MNSKQKLSGAVVVAVLVAGFCYFWFPRGYGEVSRPTYEYAKALYGACLAKSDERISKIETLLDIDANSPKVSRVPENERRWLRSIVKLAQNKNWKSAADRARAIMEDQVEH